MDNKEAPQMPKIQFNYEFLTDPGYVNSAFKGEIDALKIPDIITAQTKEIVKDLRVDYPLTIGVYIPEDYEKSSVIPTLGIGGRAIKDREVRLFLDPEHQKVVESVKKYQERQLAHEINHTSRFHLFPDEKRTLGRSLVYEGLATFYEENWEGVYPPTPWGIALSPQELESLGQIARTHYFSEYNHGRWFFGAEGKYPVWAGYSLGNDIIRRYKENNPNIEMRDLIKIPTRQILEIV